MQFKSPEIVMRESPLRQRVLRFCLLDAELVLDADIDYERATKRHKFKAVRWWKRLDGRNNNMDRRDIPNEAIEAALANVRSQIQYAERKVW